LKNTIFCLLLLAAGSVAHAASFDCSKAATSIEKMICSDENISDLDSQLMQSYKNMLSTAANAEALKLEQRAWLANVRNKCKDAACLKVAYAVRIAQLDVAAKPLSVQATQSVSVASVIDQPKANDAPAVAATPNDIAQASVQPVVVPQPQKVEASSQVITPAKPTPVIETPAATSSSPSNPGMGITDVFHVLFAIGMIALIAGMVRPLLAARWIKAPTRKKVLGIMLIYLVPVAALSSFTRTPERIAYEASVQKQIEAERQAKRAEQEAREVQGRAASSSGSAGKCISAALDVGYVDGQCAYSFINACVTTGSRSEMNRMLQLTKVMDGRVNVTGCSAKPTTYVNQFDAAFAHRDRY
jgi:uncharacterized protein